MSSPEKLLSFNHNECDECNDTECMNTDAELDCNPNTPSSVQKDLEEIIQEGCEESMKEDCAMKGVSDTKYSISDKSCVCNPDSSCDRSICDSTELTVKSNSCSHIISYEPGVKDNSTSSQLGINKIPIEENDIFNKKFVIWKNEQNLCWLHSTMILLAFNNGGKLYDQNACLLSYIIKSFSQIQDQLNSETLSEVRVKHALIRLSKIRDTILNYLSPKLKYRKGRPDSAFCAIYNILQENNSSKALFETVYLTQFFCLKCLKSKLQLFKKCVISINKLRSFNPVNQACLCCCPYCKSENQIHLIKYMRISECLVFHIETGMERKLLKATSFILDGQLYRLTGVILRKTLTEQCHHFLTWLRDPDCMGWLECDDLKSSPISFTVNQPDIYLNEIHILMYEICKKELESEDYVNVPRGNLIEIPKDFEQECEPEVIDLLDTDDEDVSESMDHNSASGANQIFPPELENSNSEKKDEIMPQQEMEAIDFLDTEDDGVTESMEHKSVLNADRILPPALENFNREKKNEIMSQQEMEAIDFLDTEDDNVTESMEHNSVLNADHILPPALENFNREKKNEIMSQQEMEAIDFLDTEDGVTELMEHNSVSSANQIHPPALENSNSEKKSVNEIISQHEVQFNDFLDTECEGGIELMDHNNDCSADQILPPTLKTSNTTKESTNHELLSLAEIEVTHHVDTEDEGDFKLIDQDFSGADYVNLRITEELEVVRLPDDYFTKRSSMTDKDHKN